MYNKYLSWLRIIIGLLTNISYLYILSLIYSSFYSVNDLGFIAYTRMFDIVLLNIVIIVVSSLLYSSIILGVVNCTVIFYTNKYVVDLGIGSTIHIYLASLIPAIVIATLISSKIFGVQELIQGFDLEVAIDSSSLHLCAVYFAVLSLSTTALYPILHTFTKLLVMNVLGIIINAVVTIVLSLHHIRKYSSVILLGIVSIISYLALVPIIAYILLNTRQDRALKKNVLFNIITQNEKHVYFGKAKAMFTYGMPRNIYKEIQHYKSAKKKRAWYWRKIEHSLFVNLKSLPNRHILITGASGTGKSLLAKHLVNEIYRKYGFSFIVIDPHNEYKILEKIIPEINVINASMLGINPLELGRLNPKEKAHQISSFITTLFRLGPIQRHLLEDLLLQIYEFKGIYPDNPETWDREPPTINDLLELCQRIMDKNELYKKIYPYLRILADNVFSSTNISFRELINKPSIITLNNLKSDFVKALYVNALLQRILDNMYLGSLKKELAIVLDEAYLFLRKGLSRNVISRLLMESRKYGIGFIIISQQILTVPDPVIENSSIKIFFNISEPKNLEYASRILGGSEEKSKIIHVKSALRNLKSYNYILSISGFSEIFIVNEEDIAQNMYTR